MKVYIAGSITNNPNYVEDFFRAEFHLENMGHTVLNPCKKLGFSYKDYIDMGLCELMKCEAIYLLRGFDNSEGALLEEHYAKTTGMTLIYEGNE